MRGGWCGGGRGPRRLGLPLFGGLFGSGRIEGLLDRLGPQRQLPSARYYEEVGLVVPSARSQGGFRLYTDADVQRLHLVKRMKPLELTLEQTRELLDLMDRLAGPHRLGKAERARMLATLGGYREAVRARCETLREQLDMAETFDATLAQHVDALAAHDAPALRR